MVVSAVRKCPIRVDAAAGIHGRDHISVFKLGTSPYTAIEVSHSSLCVCPSWFALGVLFCSSLPSFFVCSFVRFLSLIKVLRGLLAYVYIRTLGFCRTQNDNTVMRCLLGLRVLHSDVPGSTSSAFVS